MVMTFENVTFAYLDEPPFCFPDPFGQPSGCDVEVARTALSAIGVKKIDTVLVTFADLLPGIVDGRWTMTTGLFVTPERETIVDFSRPIWALPDGLMVLAGNPRHLTSYEAVAADSTARLGVVTNQVQRDSGLRAGIPTQRIIDYATQEAAVSGLLAGEVEAYASVAMAHHGYLRRAGDARLAVVEIAPPDQQSEQASPASGAFAFSKTSNDLRRAVDEALGRYLGSTEHRDLMARFGFSSREVDRIL
jgi:polar amino acid transport system substrate-binding protein